MLAVIARRVVRRLAEGGAQARGHEIALADWRGITREFPGDLDQKIQTNV